MCFRFGCRPDYLGGAVIASLKPGDEVTVRKGFGYPPAEEDTVEIIATAHQMSALTASGRALGCDDGYGVEATGQHFEEGEYELSPEAQMIMERTSLQKASEGKFRVIGGTPFDENWKIVGDFDTFKKARAIADGLDRPTRTMYVYDDQGERLHESGTF